MAELIAIVGESGPQVALTFNSTIIKIRIFVLLIINNII